MLLLLIFVYFNRRCKKELTGLDIFIGATSVANVKIMVLLARTEIPTKRDDAVLKSMKQNTLFFCQTARWYTYPASKATLGQRWANVRRDVVPTSFSDVGLTLKCPPAQHQIVTLDQHQIAMMGQCKFVTLSQHHLMTLGQH